MPVTAPVRGFGLDTLIENRQTPLTMRRFRKQFEQGEVMRNFLTSLLIGCASMAQGMTINGNFSDGLNGYEQEVCAFVCSMDPFDTGKFLSVEQNGSNPYLEVNSGLTSFGFIQASATQDIQITDDAHILTFDAIQFPTITDPTSSAVSMFPDGLSVLIMDQSNWIKFIFEMGETGFLFNPFGNTDLDVSQTAASDPFFGTGVQADLSAFIGQTVNLGIFAFNENDGISLRGGFDNFSLSAPAIAPVPLPAGLPLLVAALGVLGLIRRRAQT